MSLKTLAAQLGLSQDAIQKKSERLGLEVVDAKAPIRTTTSIVVPKNLPSVEEALGMLAGALQAACKPGLDKVEVQRLQVVATLARTYKDIVGDYVDYHGLEVELQKMRENYEFWQRKTTGVQAKQFFPVIPKNLKKPEELCVRRFGVQVRSSRTQKNICSTTSQKLPAELPSV